MGKHNKAHISVNKPGTDENMRGGILVQCAGEVVDFQYYTHIAKENQDRIFKCSDCAIEKYHGKRQRRRSRGPASV